MKKIIVLLLLSLTISLQAQELRIIDPCSANPVALANASFDNVLWTVDGDTLSTTTPFAYLNPGKHIISATFDGVTHYVHTRECNYLTDLTSLSVKQSGNSILFQLERESEKGKLLNVVKGEKHLILDTICTDRFVSWVDDFPIGGYNDYTINFGNKIYKFKVYFMPEYLTFKPVKGGGVVVQVPPLLPGQKFILKVIDPLNGVHDRVWVHDPSEVRAANNYFLIQSQLDVFGVEASTQEEVIYEVFTNLKL